MAELFIVGAQRSGTTYLYDMLDSHPEILMAKPKKPEPKFFLCDKEYEKGKKYYEQRYFAERTSKHGYIGEKSTSYIESGRAATRIKSFYPNTRILMILRNPVERAYSNYKFTVDNGLEHLTFEAALSSENERVLNADYDTSVSPYAYQHRGNYIEYIRKYSKVFDRSNILIIIHEEFISNKLEISRLYSWLGVDESHLPVAYNNIVNNSKESSIEKNKVELSKSGLYISYADSNKQLEDYLGRKIDVWDPV